MKELVFLDKASQPVTSSLKVAEVFEKPHNLVMRAVRNFEKDCEDACNFAQMFFLTNYADEYGRQQPMYLMNQKGFSLLAMGFTGKKALKFKSDFYDAFEAMRKALERNTADWQSIRQITIDSTKRLHKVIQEVLIPIARANGSNTKDDIFHQHYEKLINKTVKIPAGQRPKLSYSLQSDIARLDEVIETSIIKQANAGATHSEIYSGTKSTVEAYSEVALFGDRITLAQIFAPPKVIKSATIQLSLF